MQLRCGRLVKLPKEGLVESIEHAIARGRRAYRRNSPRPSPKDSSETSGEALASKALREIRSESL
jgi:hypothetical protein